MSFTNNHPLGYYAKKNKSIRNLNYLKIDPKILLHEDVMFADGVANKRGTNIMPILEALTRNKIEKTLLYKMSSACLKTSDPKILSAKKCEILVPHIVPTEMIVR